MCARPIGAIGFSGRSADLEAFAKKCTITERRRWRQGFVRPPRARSPRWRRRPSRRRRRRACRRWKLCLRFTEWTSVRASSCTRTPRCGDASPIRLRQDGSDSAAFVPGTSTVIWPCAYSLGDFLCDATAAVRASDDPRRGDPAHAASLGAITPETVVVEVGAGLGLAGLVAARLGAKRVSITDATTAAARRNLEASGLTNATVDELWWQRASWRRARGKAKKQKALDLAPSEADATCSDESEPESDQDEPPDAPDAAATVASVLRSLRLDASISSSGDSVNEIYPHMIVASDVCYSQGRREMQMLADTMGALCGFETTLWLMFEDRGDCCWGTLQHFWRAAESAGLEGDPTPVEEVTVLGEPRTSQRRHNDSERLLLRLRRVRETPAE